MSTSPNTAAPQAGQAGRHGHRFFHRLIGSALAVAGLVSGSDLATASEPAAGPLAEFFEKEVRPLLAGHCFQCHGPQKQRGGLRLDSRAAILRGGETGPAAIAGQPAKSLLIAAIRHEGDLQMPPPDEAPRLSEKQVSTLAQWVELGLPWPADVAAANTDDRRSQAARHWAFQPVRRPDVPAVKQASWVRSPIDAFILARLEGAGLQPSPPADRRALIRRATYDLTGLPPTAAEVDAFIADTSPDAYERLIDRLLASPHYGEQWARHWLDLARYSDTKGYVYAREERSWVHAWTYRDWVVAALNQDMPYDRFVTLQLAADQLPDEPPGSLAAMGFLTLGRRFLGVTHDIIDDRIDVVTRGLLGFTVGCARCHDHKYDPITTRDYYALYGLFRNCREQFIRLRAPAAGSKAAEEFEHGLAERQKSLHDRMATARAEAANRVRARVADYLAAQGELQKYPEEGFDQILAPSDLFPAFVRGWRDYLEQAKRQADPVWATWHALRALPPSDFSRQAAAVCEGLAQASPSDVNPLVAAAFASPPADVREVAARYGRLLTETDLAWQDLLAAARRSGEQLPSGFPDAAREALRAVLYGTGSPCEVAEEEIVNNEQFFPTSVCENLWKLQGEVDRWLLRAPVDVPCALTLTDRSRLRNARVLRRGNPANPGEEVASRFIECLAQPGAAPFQHGSGRLELARAIVDPRNPLTARVIVNRIWAQHFGSGLVRTPSDFGLRAEAPSHPALLDWLAAQLVADGWSLKRLHRAILLSATYRQGSPDSADKENLARALAADPENRLLCRVSPRRLSFEELRDSLLAAAGELDERVGGRAAELFGYPFPRRRALYGLVDRQFLPAVMQAFDFANPDLHIPQRNETTVPQQALFLLNNPLLVERARALAARQEVRTAESESAKVKTIYRILFQRAPTADQATAALALVQAANTEDAPPLPEGSRAWQHGTGRLDEEAGRVQDFAPLPFFTGTAWQNGVPWADDSRSSIQWTAGGGRVQTTAPSAAVRRWTAPRPVKVNVYFTVAHRRNEGKGVRVFANSSRNGVLATATIRNTKAEFERLAIDLQAGDTLDFGVANADAAAREDFDALVRIVENAAPGTPPHEWNSSQDFGGVPTLHLQPWEQLVHALLLTNEFAFVD